MAIFFVVVVALSAVNASITFNKISFSLYNKSNNNNKEPLLLNCDLSLLAKSFFFKYIEF